MKDQKSILLIANLVSQMGRGTAVSENLHKLLSENGWKIYTASGKVNRLFRLLDMLITSWRYRDYYYCAFVEVYSGKAFFWSELICILLHFIKKPFVLGLFGGNLPNFAADNPERVDALLRNASRILAPSQYLMEQIRPYTSRKIDVFPYGVSLKRFQYKLRTQIEPKLISIRGFHSIYCPWVSVETLALLKDDFPNMELVMSGGDKHDGSLEKTEQIIKENSLKKYVELMGFAPQHIFDQRLMEADILLNMPSLDNTPVSVIQAMACGLCIVSTNVGGLPYLIEDEKDGLLISPDNPIAAATAIRRILNETGLASRLSKNARLKAEQYDWSVIFPKWEKMFEEIILGTSVNSYRSL